jgi:hypothetical protein
MSDKTKRRPHRERADLDRAIGLFREIANSSADGLILADRPLYPDAELLDLCAQALDKQRTAELAGQAAAVFPHWMNSTDQERASQRRLTDERMAATLAARTFAARARKLRAKTGAGIYAKALVVRDAPTGAPALAKSLAEDLIAQPELRALLWPASAEEIAENDGAA